MIATILKFGRLICLLSVKGLHAFNNMGEGNVFYNVDAKTTQLDMDMDMHPIG